MRDKVRDVGVMQEWSAEINSGAEGLLKAE